ncbi:hypothetical protein BGX38DRAFT_489744 [Terfezia claveryi]|nr:hypothetical protein BGX38DRAFT_489744 [Terfezia claveryi]
MKLYLGIAFIVVASFIPPAAPLGLQCNTGCAACWKDGSPGVDIKFACGFTSCGRTCPQGYSGIHCANSARCECWPEDDNCTFIGPCWCGEDPDATHRRCRVRPKNDTC